MTLRPPSSKEEATAKLHHSIRESIEKDETTAQPWSLEPLKDLMASGADPNMKLRKTNGYWISDDEGLTALDILGETNYGRYKLRELFDFALFAKIHGDMKINFEHKPETELHNQEDFTVKDLAVRNDKEWLDAVKHAKSGCMHMHVPENNVREPKDAVIAAGLILEGPGCTVQFITEALKFRYRKFAAPNEVADLITKSFGHHNITLGDPFLQFRPTTYQAPSTSEELSKLEYNHTAIVFPYLELSTVKEQKTTREKYKRVREILTKPTDSDKRQCMVHTERTLDEAYYPGLSSAGLVNRNDDQVVSKKYVGTTTDLDRIPLLMVPQLWIWRFDNVIISAFPSRGRSIAVETQDVNAQMGLIMVHCIEQFAKWRDVGKDDKHSALDIFESSVMSILWDVDLYIKSAGPTKTEYYREYKFLHDLSDIRGELAMIQDILTQQKDILTSLLAERPVSKRPGKQEPNLAEAIERLIVELQHRSSESGSGSQLGAEEHAKTSTPEKLPDTLEEAIGRKADETWNKIERARSTIALYERRIKKIDGDAERAEKTVQDKLNLKRTYVSMREAHISLLLSTSVIGFTVITIVFAPLAFLTALFALNIEGFDILKGADGVYRSGKLAGIFVSSEVLTLVVTALCVLGALKYLESSGEENKSQRKKSGEPDVTHDEHTLTPFDEIKLAPERSNRGRRQNVDRRPFHVKLDDEMETGSSDDATKSIRELEPNNEEDKSLHDPNEQRNSDMDQSINGGKTEQSPGNPSMEPANATQDNENGTRPSNNNSDQVAGSSTADQSASSKQLLTSVTHETAWDANKRLA